MRRISLILKNNNTLDVIKITLGTGLYAISLFILRSIIGNYFGPDHLGAYTLLFVIYNFGFQFVALGMGVSLTKYIAEFSNNSVQVRNLIGFGLTISTISGVVFSSISMGLSKVLARGLFHDETFYLPIILVSLSFPFISLLQTSLGILNGLFKISKYSISYLILTVFTLLVTLLGIFLLNDTSLGYSLGILIPTAITAVLAVLFIYKHVNFKLRTDFTKKKNFLTFATLTVIINSIAFINNQITSVILGSYLTTAEVGIFSAALTIVQGLLLFPYAAQRIVMPRVSKLYAEDKWSEIKDFNRKAMLSVLVIYAIFAVLFTILARPIINLIFSPDFSDSVILLWILLPTSIIYSLNATLGGVLAAIERLKINVIVNGILSLVTIAISLVLVIFVKTLGAAIALGIFYVISTVTNLIILFRFNAI